MIASTLNDVILWSSRSLLHKFLKKHQLNSFSSRAYFVLFFQKQGLNKGGIFIGFMILLHGCQQSNRFVVCKYLLFKLVFYPFLPIDVGWKDFVTLPFKIKFYALHWIFYLSPLTCVSQTYLIVKKM